MKITLFTSNKTRHNYLINFLSSYCDELYVIQECGTIFPGLVPGHYPASKLMEKYFKSVNKAQKFFFKDNFCNKFGNNIKFLSMLSGDLNKCSINFLQEFLKSDYYIVFGSSYIKGELIDFLVDKKAINIHMGISPFYRGCDCNFWALYDNNPHMVGATIHLISKGLDSGPILYHAISKHYEDPFLYSMSTVMSAFHSLPARVFNNSILDLNPEKQEKCNEIRYSTKKEFNEEIVKKFFSSNIILEKFKNKTDFLKNPYVLG